MRQLVRFYDARTDTTDTNLERLARGRALDVDALGAYLCRDAPLPKTQSLYQDISVRLEPTAFRAPPSALPPLADERTSDLRTAIHRIRTTVESAVAAAVGDCRRVAVSAGGGIDSSAVLALAHRAAKRNGGSAFAVAIDFPCPGDDRPHLANLARHVGCEVVRVRPEDGARHLSVLREGMTGLPAFAAFAPVQLALYEAARREGAECVLFGSGGDELFDGQPRALARLALRRPLEAARRARSLTGFWDSRAPVIEHVLRPLVARAVPRRLRRMVARRRRPPPFTAPWASPKLDTIARRLADRTLEAVLYPPETRAEYFDAPWKYLYATFVQQEEHASGVARKEPYYSREVAEVVDSIAPHLLLAGGRRRGLFCEAMRGYVPDSLLDRNDKAEFSPAFRRFLAAAGGVDALGEALEGRCLGRLGLVDRAAFRRQVVAALEDPDESGRYALAWAAVAAESFLLRRPELA